MSIDSSKTKAVSMDFHHESRFLYIRYSPALLQVGFAHGWQALHTLSHLGGFAPGWHALQKNCCVFCSVRTPVSPPFGQTRPLRGLKQCPRWRLAVQTSRRKPRNVFFAGHAIPRTNPASSGAMFSFRACHPWANPASSGAMFPCRACHPWANPASSGAMFPCRVCHQGRISDRFIPAFR